MTNEYPLYLLVAVSPPKTLTPPRKASNVDVTNMEDRIDQAARRTAINLMRLNEALEHRDAEHYSGIPQRTQASPRLHRHHLLAQFYRQWFLGVARGSEQGKYPDKGEVVGLDPRRLNMEGDG